MRIWFDLSNSPHINMFGGLIRELEGDNDVVITCRPLANTIDLLDLHKLQYTTIGSHYGRRLLPKLYGFPVRVLQLRRFLARRSIDVAVSQSSFHSPVVARLLGIPSIYMNDNEHALGNVPAFACATVIMVPEYLRESELRRQGASLRKLLRYPGVKEGIYLWQIEERVRRRRAERPRRVRKVVYVRPEPWTAQYYKGARDFLDEMLVRLSERVDVVLLPRGVDQAAHYEAPRFSCVRVVRKALDIEDIAPDCDLFIGAGGTMTREMAVLGVPTLSVYQDALLDVDRYLLDSGAFVHRPDLSAADAFESLESLADRPPNRDLLEKGRSAYELLKKTILTL